MTSLLLSETMGSYQATSERDNNLGFGLIYYALTRVLRPETVCVIGSKAGFSVICLALGMKDNAGTVIKDVGCWDTQIENTNSHGKLYFIDPSFQNGRDENHWYGVGFWDDPEKVIEHWKKFGVEAIVSHFKMTSAEFLKDSARPKDIQLLLIDGDHSYEGISHDFNQFFPHLTDDAVIVAHDVDPNLKIIDPNTGGYQALMDLDKNKFEVFRMPVFPGLALVRKKNQQ